MKFKITVSFENPPDKEVSIKTSSFIEINSFKIVDILKIHAKCTDLIFKIIKMIRNIKKEGTL